jgi:hypothetical protein
MHVVMLQQITVTFRLAIISCKENNHPLGFRVPGNQGDMSRDRLKEGQRIQIEHSTNMTEKDMQIN